MRPGAGAADAAGVGIGVGEGDASSFLPEEQAASIPSATVVAKPAAVIRRTFMCRPLP